MNAKTIVAVAVATALFSGSALAASGNPENPDASTKNWQLNELRQDMNTQVKDLSNRIDKIQTGSASGAVDQLRSEVNTRFDNVDRDINDLKDNLADHERENEVQFHVTNQRVTAAMNKAEEVATQVGNKVDKDDFLKDQQKQNDRMDGMQDLIDNNGDRLNAVEKGLNDTNSRLDSVNNRIDSVSSTADKAADKAQNAMDIALDARVTADRIDSHNRVQDTQIAGLDATKADRSELNDVADKAKEAKQEATVAAGIAIDAKNQAEAADAHNAVQDGLIADLQTNKVDRSELEDVAIKADGALAGAIENRNQIDQLRGDLADTDKQVATNKKDIADLKNQNGALNNAVTDAQNTANAASDKADKAQNTADKAVAGVNNVKNDVKVVSRDVANNSIRIQRNEERIDGAYAGIYDNRKNIEANRKAINRNGQEIQKLNKNFNDLKNTVDANRKRAAAGIAGVAAMANIPEVNSHQTFSLGVGVGGFDGQQAVAVGASARVNDNLTVKASVAANNEEVVWGAGAAIGW